MREYRTTPEQMETCGRVTLGYTGENCFSKIHIDCTAWLSEYPDAQIDAIYRRPDQRIYPLVIEKSGCIVSWEPTLTDLAVSGFAALELQLHSGEEIIGKSGILKLSILQSLDEAGDPPPQETAWVTQVLNAANDAKDAKNAAGQAAQKAEAAVGKTSYIDPTTGTWWQWNAERSSFEDTHVSATGPQGPGLLPQIIVTTLTGATVTCTKDGLTITGTSVGGKCTIEVPDYGTWELQASLQDYVSEKKSQSVTCVQQYSVTLDIRTYNLYGVEWTQGASPVMTRIEDAKNFSSPVPYHPGVTNYGSPFDSIAPWNGICCVTDPVAGELVAIPKYWYKWTKTGSKLTLLITDEAVSGFHVSPAHAKSGKDIVYVGRYHCNSGYKSVSGAIPIGRIPFTTAQNKIKALGRNIGIFDIYMYWTIAMLYLVEFANWDSQAKIGYGCSEDTGAMPTGSGDRMPYHTGSPAAATTYHTGVCYRYIEDLWGNLFDWCAGSFMRGSDIYMGDATAESGNPGTKIGSVPFTRGYIGDFVIPTQSQYAFALIPSANAGSSSQSVCDFFYAKDPETNSDYCLRIGGYWEQTLGSGLFYQNYNYKATDQGGGTGCRLLKY